MKYIGLDLGTRTLGVAFSDPLGLVARSHTIIRHEEDYEKLVMEVEKLMKDENASAIVLGLPKMMNNKVGERALKSYEFKKMLEEKLGVEVFLEDERLSTKEAENLLISNDTSRKKRKKVIDSLAATIILQSFLDKKGR